MQEYLNQKQVCDYLQIGRKKFYELIKLPAFPAVRIGRCVRIVKTALAEWAAEQKSI